VIPLNVLSKIAIIEKDFAAGAAYLEKYLKTFGHTDYDQVEALRIVYQELGVQDEEIGIAEIIPKKDLQGTVYLHELDGNYSMAGHLYDTNKSFDRLIKCLGKTKDYGTWSIKTFFPDLQVRCDFKDIKGIRFRPACFWST